MNASYISCQTPLFASEINSFRLELVLEEQVQSLSDLDIAVTVFTSQLSPRQTIISAATGESPVETSAYIARNDDHFILVLAPDFLKTLPTGILTLSITYSKENFMVTNVLVTEKFINDLSECAGTTLI